MPRKGARARGVPAFLATLSVVLLCAGCDDSPNGQNSNPSGPTPGPTTGPTTTPVSRWVAPNGSNTSNCANQGAPCQTIQYAHDQASAGDTVNVEAGPYTGSLSIAKSLVVRGTSGSGQTNVVGGFSVAKGSGNVSVIGFSLTPSAGQLDGITLAGVERGATVTLSDLKVSGFLRLGINVSMDDGTLTISNVTVTSSGDDGVRIDKLLPGTAVGSINVSGLTVRGNGGDGLWVTALSDLIDIRNVVAEDNNEAGIQFEVVQDSSLSLVDSCVRRNGKVRQAGISLVRLVGSGHYSLQNSNIAGNVAGAAELSLSSGDSPQMLNNWWGRASGPSSIVLPDAGTGDSITAGIQIQPVATSAFPTLCPP